MYAPTTLNLDEMISLGTGSLQTSAMLSTPASVGPHPMMFNSEMRILTYPHRGVWPGQRLDIIPF